MSVCLVGFNLKGVLAKSLVNCLLVMGDPPFLKVWSSYFFGEYDVHFLGTSMD